jgi:hypothetical protein
MSGFILLVFNPFFFSPTGLDFGEQFDATFENALAAAGYGKFHYILVIFGGLLYAYAAISITVLSFVLPSAQCDFGMTSSDKGWLNAAPMLGEYSFQI